MSLAGGYAAAAYAQPYPMQCRVARTMVRTAPRVDAGAGSELLLGEPFRAVEISGAWAWGYAGPDGYVGYVPAAALGAGRPPSHRVAAPTALIFIAPDIRSAAVGELPMGARVASGGSDGLFEAVDGGFVHRRHLAPIDSVEPDWVGVAAQFVGAPYLWGGRSRWGIDCSGLVQVALAAGGTAAPRDSDMQFEALGEIVGTPRRGDLAFFPGHVGIMVDETQLLHANAYWMATVIEPLAAVIERSGAEGRPLTAFRRL